LDPDTELHPDVFESAQSNNVVRANAQTCPEPGIGRLYRRNAMKKKNFETQVVGRYCMRWQSLLVENLDLLTLRSYTEQCPNARKPLGKPRLDNKAWRRCSCSVITRPLNSGCGGRTWPVIVPRQICVISKFPKKQSDELYDS
jgi:hypothetical protein